MTDTDTAEKPRRGRPKTQSESGRRVAITQMATATFVELGFAGATTDVVAARCRISKQTLYRIFPSKLDMFLAVVAAHRRLMLDLPRPVEENEPCAVVLARIFKIDIDEVAESERQAIVQLVRHESDHAPELHEILKREGIDRSRQYLADWLSIEAARGKLVIDDALASARMLMDLLFGAMGHRRNDFVTQIDRRIHLQRCIALFEKGSQ
jgi:AcrR family transcriptional regulator